MPIFNWQCLKIRGFADVFEQRRFRLSCACAQFDQSFAVLRYILQYSLSATEGPEQPARLRRVIRAFVFRNVHEAPFLIKQPNRYSWNECLWRDYDSCWRWWFTISLAKSSNHRRLWAKKKCVAINYLSLMTWPKNCFDRFKDAKKHISCNVRKTFIAHAHNEGPGLRLRMRMLMVSIRTDMPKQTV